MNPIEQTLERGGLPTFKIQTPWSTAEVMSHGAHVTSFQKHGEEPMLFLSAKSLFSPGNPIRGGVPICYPWFGAREGDSSHGFARTTEWLLAESAAGSDGAVRLRFKLPIPPDRPAWSGLRTEFFVTVSDSLTMELLSANESGAPMEIENCLHTYFRVGHIRDVSLTGLQGAPFLDFASGAAGDQKVERDEVLQITKETNRTYPDTTATVEILDRNLMRLIRVEKFHSRSTVVWNPWTTQKLPDDFDPAEHQHMVCVESGNVKQNKLTLAPGEQTTLKAVLSTAPLGFDHTPLQNIQQAA